MTICPKCKYEWKDEGRRKGGLISRRKLEPKDSAMMHAAKAEKKRKRNQIKDARRAKALAKQISAERGDA